MTNEKTLTPAKVKLTSTILKKIKPEQIVYAEFADFGAMGACGTARIFATDNRGGLAFYLTGDTYKNEKDRECLSETIEYLLKLKQEERLIYADGGVGNATFKNPEANFARDDDRHGFIYELGGQKFFIASSVAGVYCHIASKFAPRKVSIEALEMYLADYRPRLSDEESDFARVYIEQLKRDDSGQGWFDFTPLDYYNAIKYIKHQNAQDFLLNWAEIADGRKALQKYRLNYIIDKIGWNTLNEIFSGLIDDKSYKVFAKISQALGEKVERIYSQVETVQAGKVIQLTGTNYRSSVQIHELSEKLFSHPKIISFTKEERTKINNSLMRCALNPNGRAIGMYLANYILSEDKISYTEILPAVARIIRDLPTDDFNHEHTAEVFWLCGSIIDSCWRYASEDETAQRQFRDFVYSLYWPRVGSLWPILHRDEFSFNEDSANKMFDDAASFVFSLSDIDERNPEIKAYLAENAKNINYYDGVLGRSAFYYRIKGLTSQEQFEVILRDVDKHDYHEFLSHPSTILEADILLKELFRTDEEARIASYTRMSVLEALLITANTKGVGRHILGYVAEHLDELEKIIKSEGLADEEEGSTPVLSDLFIAACKGITEEDELLPLHQWKNKLLDKGDSKRKLESADKFAKIRQKTVAFQRNEIQLIFDQALLAFLRNK